MEHIWRGARYQLQAQNTKFPILKQKSRLLLACSVCYTERRMSAPPRCLRQSRFCLRQKCKGEHIQWLVDILNGKERHLSPLKTCATYFSPCMYQGSTTLFVPIYFLSLPVSSSPCVIRLSHFLPPHLSLSPPLSPSS